MSIHTLSGDWVRGEPRGCLTKCGVKTGISGTPGTVTCTTSSCDPHKKPLAKLCPATPLCGELSGITITAYLTRNLANRIVVITLISKLNTLSVPRLQPRMGVPILQFARYVNHSFSAHTLHLRVSNHCTMTIRARNLHSTHPRSISLRLCTLLSPDVCAARICSSRAVSYM